MKKNDIEVISELWGIIEDRRANPKTGSYTNKLLTDPKKILEKLEEELGEIEEAVEKGIVGDVDEKDSLIWECSDLLYHLMVLVASQGADFGQVLQELKRRRK